MFISFPSPQKNFLPWKAEGIPYVHVLSTYMHATSTKDYCSTVNEELRKRCYFRGNTCFVSLSGDQHSFGSCGFTILSIIRFWHYTVSLVYIARKWYAQGKQVTQCVRSKELQKEPFLLLQRCQKTKQYLNFPGMNDVQLEEETFSRSANKTIAFG